MGWSIGYDEHWERDIGYGVPCLCDHPGCTTKIDRGLSYVCGDDLYGGGNGCGLYFCPKHLRYRSATNPQACARCRRYREPFNPKPDIEEWTRFKETDESWAEWRKERDAKLAASR